MTLSVPSCGQARTQRRLHAATGSGCTGTVFLGLDMIPVLGQRLEHLPQFVAEEYVAVALLLNHPQKAAYHLVSVVIGSSLLILGARDRDRREVVEFFFY